MFIRTQTTAGRTYVLLVENERVDGRIKQRVLLRLGRLDQLQASGQLDSLLASLGRLSDKLAVLGAHGRGESVSTRTRHIGAALIFERLWQECGIAEVLRRMLRDRRFEFPLERAVFMTVMHRLMVSGSDRAAERWMRRQAIAGAEPLSLHHLYRAMGFLGEPIEAQPVQQPVPAGEDAANAAALALRTRKDLIEEALFAQRRDLFTDVELVFFDTTSIYFEGALACDLKNQALDRALDCRSPQAEGGAGLAIAQAALQDAGKHRPGLGDRLRLHRLLSRLGRLRAGPECRLSIGPSVPPGSTTRQRKSRHK